MKLRITEMGHIEVLRAADRVAMPWKNGGGITHEVAIFPADAGMDDFLWRLSMAEVTAPGPFSAFPGIDRVLAVLDGTLHLSGDTIGDIFITPQSTPCAFPGDAAVNGQPIGGPVLDLNAMVRTGAYRAEMRHLASGNHKVGASSAAFVALGPVRCEADGIVETLDRLDCLLLEDVMTIGFTGTANALLVRFLPA